MASMTAKCIILRLGSAFREARRFDAGRPPVFSRGVFSRAKPAIGS
jgi:hypothetical protein